MKKTEFIERIAGYVEKYAYVYGIMVHSPIIAQAILESGWGESKLASLYHNYFGLKCGTRWTGKSVNMKTSEEYTPGVHTLLRIHSAGQIQESARRHGSAAVPGKHQSRRLCDIQHVRRQSDEAGQTVQSDAVRQKRRKGRCKSGIFKTESR